MGNSVSAHIWTPLSIGGKKLVSLGTTKFGVLGGKVTVHV